MAFPEGTDLNKPFASEADLKELKGWMIGVMVVVGVVFITLVIQYFSASQTTYQALKDQVSEQNAKIDALTDEIHRAQPVCTDHMLGN